MKKHIPNSIPLKYRLLIIVAIASLLLYITAELMIGSTFLPGRGGGYLLSGFPTLLIVLANLVLCFGLALFVVDHYDKRPNEQFYKSLQTKCFVVTIGLIIAAPVCQILETVFLALGWDVFPNFHGFASQYSFYSPALKRFLPYLHSLQIPVFFLGVAAVVCIFFSLYVMKFKREHNRQGVLVGLYGFVCLSLVFLYMTTEDLLMGEVTTDKVVHSAMSDPSQFNAVMLTHFMMGFSFLVGSAASLIAVHTQRIKLLDTWSD